MWDQGCAVSVWVSAFGKEIVTSETQATRPTGVGLLVGLRGSRDEVGRWKVHRGQRQPDFVEKCASVATSTPE